MPPSSAPSPSLPVHPVAASAGGRGTHRIDEVVAAGMCVGCGVCAVVTDGRASVTFGTSHLPTVSLDGLAESDRRRASEVCPFSDDAPDEDALGPPRPGDADRFDDRLGRYRTIVAARRLDDAVVTNSSSGGLTSWVTEALLERGEADGVIHVVPDPTGEELFAYVASSADAYRSATRKSNYYATTLEHVLRGIRGDGRRYILIGVPCFIKAARALGRHDPVLAGQITYYFGLVCGHLKSRGFAESMAWQLGVPPDDLAGVDFRVKDPAATASRYLFSATRRSTGERVDAPTASLTGGNWGHGAFQLDACNYCDDIFAETADVAFGDAWLPKYSSDWRGTNVVVSRSAVVDEVLRAGRDSGELFVEGLGADEAARSQGGNFRHRRIGLAVRLADDLRAGRSVPAKRVRPDRSAADPWRRRLIRQRRRMSQLSHESFERARARGDLAIYLDAFRREQSAYRRRELPTLGRRAVLRLYETALHRARRLVSGTIRRGQVADRVAAGSRRA